MEVSPESHSEKRSRDALSRAQTWLNPPAKQDPRPEDQPVELPSPPSKAAPVLPDPPPKPPPQEPHRPMTSICRSTHRPGG